MRSVDVSLSQTLTRHKSGWATAIITRNQSESRRMLISPDEMQRRFNVNPSRVLHGGAHLAEELESYNQCNFSPGGTVWVEANPRLADSLSTRFKGTSNVVINAALWSKSDSVVDFINLDIQGAELEAIKGAEKILTQIKWIYTEVNKADVYVGCAKVWEIDEYLKRFGFTRIATRWSFRDDFGDALYSKEKHFSQSLIFQVYGLLSTLYTALRYLIHGLKSKLKRHHR